MKFQRSFFRFSRLAIWACAPVFLIGCMSDTRKLDEAMIYQGPRMRIKLVRYFEDLPLHYSGEVFRVQCASPQTRDFPANKTQDAGWVSLGNGAAIDSKSAADLAERERANYRVIDDRILAWLGNGVNVSFDACGHFRAWHPASIAQDLIVPAEKPDTCMPKGKLDCRHYDFIGERAPKFDDLQVAATGEISFVVRSTALRDGKSLRVRSADYGRTWLTSF